MESVFAVNPNVNVLYVFEDGNSFISKRDADNYSNQIKKNYEVVEKTELKTTKKK